MININKIKLAAKKGISLKPTHITLKRYEITSNGMRGGKKEEVIIGEYDVFIDDSKRNMNININDPGNLTTFRSLKMIIVIEDNELLINDFFEVNSIKYRVTYPGELVPGVYEADLSIIGGT